MSAPGFLLQIRYFKVLVNALLLHSPSTSSTQKDELDDIPIELSKVQSVKVRSHTAHFDPRPSVGATAWKPLSSLSLSNSAKVVAKKRRDRGLPRAFEIFTDSKTYVLKAQDEKHAEEWLQCINVAVAQARERENREATTYL